MARLERFLGSGSPYCATPTTQALVNAGISLSGLKSLDLLVYGELAWLSGEDGLVPLKVSASSLGKSLLADRKAVGGSLRRLAKSGLIEKHGSRLIMVSLAPESGDKRDTAKAGRKRPGKNSKASGGHLTHASPDPGDKPEARSVEEPGRKRPTPDQGGTKPGRDLGENAQRPGRKRPTTWAKTPNDLGENAQRPPSEPSNGAASRASKNTEHRTQNTPPPPAPSCPVDLGELTAVSRIGGGGGEASQFLGAQEEGARSGPQRPSERSGWWSRPASQKENENALTALSERLSNVPGLNLGGEVGDDNGEISTERQPRSADPAA